MDRNDGSMCLLPTAISFAAVTEFFTGELNLIDRANL